MNFERDSSVCWEESDGEVAIKARGFGKSYDLEKHTQGDWGQIQYLFSNANTRKFRRSVRDNRYMKSFLWEACGFTLKNTSVFIHAVTKEFEQNSLSIL